MKILSVLLSSCFLAISCAPQSSNGVSRPSISTNPRSYLRSFPLSKISEDEIIQYVGAPTRTLEAGGKRYLTYDVATSHNPGVLEYTYIVQNGLVQDVTYTNAGNFFGAIQKESAQSLQR